MAISFPQRRSLPQRDCRAALAMTVQVKWVRGKAGRHCIRSGCREEGVTSTDDRTTTGIQALQDRLTRLSEASLRINEDLDYHSVLEEVTNSACMLTEARYAATTVLDDANRLEEFVTSGLTPAERRSLAEMPESARFFGHLNETPGPLRINDVAAYLASHRMAEWRPPVAVASLLVAPIRNKGVRLGSIYVTKGDAGDEFTREDEDTLVMFASQAALVIANARRYRDQQRARTDLEALIATCPVGVVVFDAKSGAPVSYNRETLRIVEQIRPPDHPVEQMMDILSIRRIDRLTMSGNQKTLQSPWPHRRMATHR